MDSSFGQQTQQHTKLMAISFLVNAEDNAESADEEATFPWLPSSSPVSSPRFCDQVSLSRSSSFSYSSSSSPPSSPHAQLLPLLPSFSAVVSSSFPSSSPSSPSSSSSYSSPPATVAELLEGLLHTMGPHAFANHSPVATPTSESSTETESSISSAMMKERGRGKGRRQASAGQVALLEEVFALEPIPTALTKARLSQLLDMPTKRIQIWFKNKRARQKKGRPRKEPFTFHYFAQRNNLNNGSVPAVLSRYRPVKPTATSAAMVC